MEAIDAYIQHNGRSIKTTNRKFGKTFFSTKHILPNSKQYLTDRDSYRFALVGKLFLM